MMKGASERIAVLARKARNRILRYLILILAAIINLMVFPFIKKIKNENPERQPVFIVGAPRTGSTALYQALTNYFNVAYIDNLASVLYRNLPLGIWLSNFLFNKNPHGNFKADFGNTQKYGWHAPSECGQFWYRWLSIEDHFVDRMDYSGKTVSEIRSEVFSAQEVAGSPLLFKNLNAGQRLRLLSDAFPKARLLYIKRDPRFVALSIMRARKKNGIQAGEWWSIKPCNFRDLIKLDELEMIVAQIFYIEKQIEEDLKLFCPDNVYVVNYNDLSHAKISEIGQWLGLPIKPGGGVPPFFQDSEETVNTEHWSQISFLVERYFSLKAGAI